MDYYLGFFGFSMFVIGLIVGRLTMAIQYEVMKPKPGPNGKARKKQPGKRGIKLERPSGNSRESRKEFYDYMKRNRRP